MSLATLAQAQTTESKELDIIEFCRSKTGFDLEPLPAQRFLLKLFEKLPLDDTIRDIEIRDKFNQHIEATYTEVEFYDFLLENNAISMDYETYLSCDTIQTLLNFGRRGTKSTTISILIGYKLYKLLRIYRPQEYFKIILTDQISITMTALGGDNAQKLFGKLYSLLKSSPFFKPHLREPASGTEVKIWTLYDLDEIKNGNSVGKTHSNSIYLQSHANSPGVRGENNVWCILDEFAHFNNSSKSTREKPLDEMIYEALTPSVSGFRAEEKPFGHTYIFSSPNGKKGKFWFEYAAAVEDGPQSFTLAITAPTWWLNPTVSPEYLIKEHNKNPEGYAREFGASFERSEGSWLKDMKKFFSSIDTRLPILRPYCEPNKTYFLGGDFALTSDGTAFAISHWEDQYVHAADAFPTEAYLYNDNLKEYLDKTDGYIILPKVVLDYAEVRYAGEGIYAEDSTLQIEKVLNWLEELYQKFPIQYGIYDQWSAEIIKQLCVTRGIKRFDVVNHGIHFNDALAKTFSLVLHSNLLVMPYNKPFNDELQSLIAHPKGEGLIKVECPDSSGNLHDDLFDAVSRSIYLSYFNKHKTKKIAALMPGLYKKLKSTRKYTPTGAMSGAAGVMQRARKNNIGGGITQRTVTAGRGRTASALPPVRIRNGRRR